MDEDFALAGPDGHQAHTEGVKELNPCAFGLANVLQGRKEIGP
jgi:hypothetical protein